MLCLEYFILQLENWFPHFWRYTYRPRTVWRGAMLFQVRVQHS